MIKKGDFIEIEFTGKVKDGEIFDTNIKEKAKEINEKAEVKPLVLCVGQKMVLENFDKALEKKEINKDYMLELKPENAFGERKKELIKTMPINIFLEKEINPQPGMVFNMDGMIVRIAAVSGGRVIADFNNPLAGKEIVYEFKIKRKIEKIEEKIKALMDFFLKRQFKFRVENKKIKIEAGKPEQQYISLFKEKFKEILGLELEFSKKQEEKKQAKEKTEKK